MDAPLSSRRERDDQRNVDLATMIHDTMERIGVPGVAVGLAHEGKAYVAGLGMAGVEDPLPVERDTLFRVGSTTKTVTALLRLAEQGEIDLDPLIRGYLHDLRLADEAAVRWGHRGGSSLRRPNGWPHSPRDGHDADPAGLRRCIPRCQGPHLTANLGNSPPPLPRSGAR